MSKQLKTLFRMDPRTGLFWLLCANIIMFTQKSVAVECGCIAGIAVLYAVSGRWISGLKWCAVFAAICLFQCCILPIALRIIVSCFAIFANYTRRAFPCVMLGWLMVKTVSLREFVVCMRKLRLPQKLIVPLTVTLRYFPAIREETGHIRDAMKLRGVHGFSKVEALTVPLMMSAAGTAEELSEAAVTRGIEDPAPKTSVLEMKLSTADYLCMAIAILYAAAAFLVQ